MSLPQKYFKEICKGSNRFLKKTLMKPTRSVPLQRMRKHRHHMILMLNVVLTHMWQKNHNMESGWVIIITHPKAWKGSRCHFTSETIRKARDPREINGRTIIGSSSSNFYSFNLHIKNKWLWRKSGTEKWSWALNFTVMWDHLHTINLKKFCEKQGFDPFNWFSMWE